MTVANTGNYSFDLNSLDDNARKRYIIAVQRGKLILDSEMSEIAFSSFTNLRNYFRINGGDAAIDDSFKIVESTSSNIDNFTITGGAGSVDHPAIMFVKGIPALITGNVEYNSQKGHIDLASPITPANSDYFTESNLPGLTPPIANRTDIVYMDLYFAEVSSEVGSEYRDTTIKNPVIGVQTSNRFRIVQDIRVAEGGSLPIDGVDGNGIYHRYLKLATIARLAGNNTITNAMITDNRTVNISIKKLTDGTGNLFIASLTATTLNITGDINMQGNLIPNPAGTSNLGDASHRFANLFMSSNIDSLGGLVINHSGATGQALKITRTGAATGNLFNVNDLFMVDGLGLVSTANVTNSTSPTTGSVTLAGGLGVAKDTFIGGSLRVIGNFTVDGTTTTVNSVDMVVTDKNITINKNGNDASSEGGGITVDRTGAKGSLIYKNSAPGKFAIGDLGSESNIVIDTRTLNVSGNGLSGGGDLSADRTITSNATDANTPSTIVFRDASGNFSAGTMSGNATGVTPNAITFAMMQQIPTNSLLGRSTAGTGNVESITVGSGLLLSGGVLSSNVGTVTNVSLVTQRGVLGSVTNPTTTPVITISLGDITPDSVTLGNSASDTGPYIFGARESDISTVPANGNSRPTDPPVTGNGRDVILRAGNAYPASQLSVYGQVGGALILRGGTGFMPGNTHNGNSKQTGPVYIADGGGDVYIGGDNVDETTRGAAYIRNGINVINASHISTTTVVSILSPDSLTFSDNTNNSHWNVIHTGLTHEFSIGSTGASSRLSVKTVDSIGIFTNHMEVSSTVRPKFDANLMVLGERTWTSDYSGSIGNLTLSKSLRIEGVGSGLIGDQSSNYRQYGSIMFGDDSAIPLAFISEHIDDSLLIHANGSIVHNSLSSHSFHIGGTTVVSVDSSMMSITGNLNVSALSPDSIVYSDGSNNLASVSIGSGLSFSGGILSAVGGGSVTSVSVVTANGISGSVANPSTTPAITLSLGAITPSSVAATGTVSGSNLSGSNTGDQTITLNGDVTGSGTGTFAATISANAVSLSKMAQVATNSLLGRSTAGTGNVEVISVGSGLLLSGGNLSVATSVWVDYDAGQTLNAGTATTFVSNFAKYCLMGNTVIIKFQFKITGASGVNQVNFNLPVAVYHHADGDRQPGYMFATDGDHTAFVQLTGTTTAYINTNKAVNTQSSTHVEATLIYPLL